MTLNKIEQVNVTENQSTLKITHDHVFLSDNRFDERTLNNVVASAQITLTSGMLLFKRSATEVDVLDAAANIENIVGILKMDVDVDLADATTREINMGISGDISEENIVLPGGVTLDTVIPTTFLTLKDRLQELGFHLVLGVEHTKFDNV